MNKQIIGKRILSDLKKALKDYKVEIYGPYTEMGAVCFDIDYKYEDFKECEEDEMKKDLMKVINDWGLGWDWYGSHIELAYEMNQQ